MESKPTAIIVMKVGPHSNMNLSEIIASKYEEERIHGVHYWGYSGVFCQPERTQQFCQWAEALYKESPKLILLETKTAYRSKVGNIKEYSIDNRVFQKFQLPVQLQGAHFSFVAKDLHVINDFNITDYIVVGGKNDGLLLNQHLRYRINKSFAKLSINRTMSTNNSNVQVALVATLTPPYAIWLKD